MKKIITFVTMFTIVCCIISPVFAANEYKFDLQYTGNIVKNEEKNANVLLIGENALPYAKVQIKVSINGPATPKILANDSLGTEIDIAKEGKWGPDEGFAVQGSFTNTTPVRATFPEEGTYTITLSLVDLSNQSSVIATKTFSLEVYEDAELENNLVPNDNNIITNNMIENNMINELPKTGTSITEYVVYITVLSIVLFIIGRYLNKKRIMG